CCSELCSPDVPKCRLRGSIGPDRLLTAVDERLVSGTVNFSCAHGQIKTRRSACVYNYPTGGK
ncbi:MAG: hypothetical protein ACLP0B_23525, partial [Steroidobacteraceae bacterium]